MIRLTLVLIVLFTFSCGDSSVTDNSVETNVATKNAEREIENSEEQPIESSKERSIWDVIDSKANDFTKGKTLHRDTKNIPQEFVDFYRRFMADSTHQTRQIDFENLVGIYSECDTTIEINPLNWRYTDWNLLDMFDDSKKTDPGDGWDNRIYFDKKSVYCQFELTEVGIISRIGFEKIKGEWKMTLYAIYNC